MIIDSFKVTFGKSFNSQSNNIMHYILLQTVSTYVKISKKGII